MTQRALLLPGSAGLDGNDDYRQLFSDLREEAIGRGFEVAVVNYPGQELLKADVLTFDGACSATAVAAKKFEPTWLVARSFGCQVLLAVLGAPGVLTCEGAVLWGPCTAAGYQRQWPDERTRIEAAEKYATQRRTRISETIFISPSLEELIQGARVNLRLCRGAEDSLNSTPEEIDFLKRLHMTAQPSFVCERREINGVGHSVFKDRVSPATWRDHCAALFTPFAVSES